MTVTVCFLIPFAAIPCWLAIGRRLEDRKRAWLHTFDGCAATDWVAEAAEQLATGLPDAHIGPVPGAHLTRTRIELHAAGLRVETAGPYPDGPWPKGLRLVVVAA